MKDFQRVPQKGPIFIFPKSTGPKNAIKLFVELEDGVTSQPVDGEARIFVRQGRDRFSGMDYEQPLVSDDKDNPSQLILPVINGKSETVTLDMSEYVLYGYEKFVVRVKDKENRESEWWCWITKNPPEPKPVQSADTPQTHTTNPAPAAQATIVTTPAATSTPTAAHPASNPSEPQPHPAPHKTSTEGHGDNKPHAQEKTPPPSCPDFTVTIPVTCDKRGYFLITAQSPQAFTVSSTEPMKVLEINEEEIGKGYSVPVPLSKGNFKSFLIAFSDPCVIQAVVTFTPELGEPISELLCKPAKGGC